MRCSGGEGGRGWANALLPQRTTPAKSKAQRAKRNEQSAKGEGRSAKSLRERENVHMTHLSSLRFALSSWLLPLCRLFLINNNSDYPVAARDLIDYFHAAHDASKNRVAAVEVGLRRMRDEPLRPARVFTRQGHAHRGAFEHHFVYLTANRVARPAILVAAWVTGLHYKVRHHTRDRLAVEVTFLRQLDEVVYIQRCIVRKKF